MGGRAPTARAPSKGGKGGGSSAKRKGGSTRKEGATRKGRSSRGGATSRGGGAARPFWRRALGRLAYWSMVLGIWVAIGVGGIVLYYGSQLPQVSEWAVPDREPVVTLVGLDGETFAQRGVKARQAGSALPLDDMSPWLPAAVIAIEDRRFHSH